MTDVFGDQIQDIPYYGLMESEVNGCPVIVSKTGFSGEDGYEIFLYHASNNAERLWYYMLEMGEPYNLKVIAPGHIRRIEGGILSYMQDMDQETNPYEVGLDWQVDLTKDEFIGKEALSRINEEGVTRKLVGMKFGGDKIAWYPPDDYIVYTDDGSEPIGYITSAFWSPDQQSNIGFAMVPSSFAEVGTQLKVYVTYPYADDLVWGEVAPTPFKKAENTSTGYRETGRKLNT